MVTEEPIDTKARPGHWFDRGGPTEVLRTTKDTKVAKAREQVVHGSPGPSARNR